MVFISFLQFLQLGSVKNISFCGIVALFDAKTLQKTLVGSEICEFGRWEWSKYDFGLDFCLNFVKGIGETE